MLPLLSLAEDKKDEPLTAFTRTFLNPARSMANLIRFRWPWHRDSRPGLRVAHQMQQSRADGDKE
jgi:hypothetical protein